MYIQVHGTQDTYQPGFGSWLGLALFVGAAMWLHRRYGR